MKEIIIGREKETKDLREWVASERSEFIAVYGRRRVGKTFLIKKSIGEDLLFHFSGSYGQPRKQQLLNFGISFKDQSGSDRIEVPENWTIAFHMISKLIEKSRRSKKIIFLDELPWMDTPKSGFISALEHFWNNFCAWREDVKLIVCGSATSWIINKIINNKGGLHNRLTHRMQVNPFDLRQSEEYFKAYGYRFNRSQIAECYMTMGGIPFYFSLMKRGESLAQNIERLFFCEDATLKDEFRELYRALFKNYQSYVEVIKALAEKGIGLTRKEILERTKLTNNGEFSKILEELELCGFIRSYLPFEKEGKRKKRVEKVSTNTLYQLIDFYTLFYLKFHKYQLTKNQHFWQSTTNSAKIITWRGITFEMLCLCHVRQIKKSLGIADVYSKTCSWYGKQDPKVQVDLLIDRDDATINFCEMKFTFKEFRIDEAYKESLQNKVNAFIEETGTRKNVLLTLVTTYGIEHNENSFVVQREVMLDDLFLPV